jgi:hypothetical protein
VAKYLLSATSASLREPFAGISGKIALERVLKIDQERDCERGGVDGEA